MRKKAILLTLVSAVSLMSWKNMEKSNGQNEEKFKLDSTETTLKWTGKYVSDGHTHTGTVKVTKGDLNVGENKSISGNFIVDMKTIDCTDLESEKKAYLTKHLNSADFFNTESFSEVAVKVNGLSDSKMDLTLKILGKEIQQVIPVEVNKNSESITVKGKFEIDFSQLDLNGFKASPGKPENQRTDSKIEFDLKLVVKK